MHHSKIKESVVLTEDSSHQQHLESREKVHDRRADIQGLRALAVIVVVLFHAGLPLTGGFIGVDIFFVISGYVITQVLTHEHQRNGAIDLKAFYFRRFKRLTPALALVVFLTIAAGVLLLSPLKEEVTTNALIGMGALGMAANAVIAIKTGGYFDVAASSTPLLHTWSLSVEEQFYIFFPLTVAFALKNGKGKLAPQKTLLATIAFFGVLSMLAAYGPMVWNTQISSRSIQWALGFYSPVTRAWEFAAGAFVFASKNILPIISSKIRRKLDIASAAALILSVAFIPGSNLWPNPLTLIPVLATALLLMPRLNEKDNGVVGKALCSTPMVKIGDLSYSWYLWHWPAIVFTSIAFGSDYRVLLAAAALSLIPAAISYSIFETPIRKLKISTYLGKAAFITTTLLLPIAISTFVLYANEKGYWSDEIAQYKSIMDELHAGKTLGCGNGKVPSSVNDSACSWPNGNASNPIYLIGDSNADHFSEAALYAGKRLKRDVRIFTKGGCAFIGDSWSDRNDLEQKSCLQYVDSSVAFLQSAPAGTVIIGMSDSIWRAGGAAVGPTRDTETSDRDKTIPYLQSDLNETILEIKKGHHQVLLLQPIPKFVTKDNAPLFEPEKCSTIAIYLGKCPQVVEMSIDDQDEIQSDARRAIYNAGITTKSEVLDMRTAYCPNGTCSNYLDGKIQFKDAGHLTVSATNLVYEPLLKKIKAMQ